MEAFLPFYGRRKGRPLRNTSKRLLEELLPAYVVPDNTSDPDKLFTHNPSKLYLEIGFGGGEHLAMVAKNHPENAYIGAEPFLNGVSSFLKYCQNEALKNVRIWPDDIRLQLSSWPNECLDGIFIMFPDPWPKKRHHKRRLIQPEFLRLLQQKLIPAGIVRLATDWAPYAQWMVEHFAANPDFELLQDDIRAATQTPPASVADEVRNVTKFEARGERLGHEIRDLQYQRVN